MLENFFDGLTAVFLVLVLRFRLPVADSDTVFLDK
jgi:hypothetical protein